MPDEERINLASSVSKGRADTSQAEPRDGSSSPAASNTVLRARARLELPCLSHLESLTCPDGG